jgi:hypothetical protein
MLGWRITTVAALALYALSSSFVVWASTTETGIAPGEITWPGVADVVTALVLVLMCMGVYTKGQPLIGTAAWRLASAVGTALMVVLLLGMWRFADRLDWNILLPGLAWRVFVLLQTLPAAIALWVPDRPASAPASPSQASAP